MSFMKTELNEEGSFDPDTIELLRNVLDDAWGTLRADEQAHTTKSEVASRILRLAIGGERDPVRLRVAALTHVVTSTL